MVISKRNKNFPPKILNSLLSIKKIISTELEVNKMDALDRSIEKYKKNKKFKKEWDKSEFEYNLTRMIIKSRLDAKMTQTELSKQTGIRQSNISRIENGDCLPSLDTLMLIAKGLNKKLTVNFT